MRQERTAAPSTMMVQAPHAVLTADMGSSQPQMVAQAVRQGQPRLDLDLDLSTVDAKSHRHGHPTARGVTRRRA